MTLMMKAAPRSVEIVAALYVGVFNVAIALGAWAGGQAVDGPGLCANLWLAAGFAAALLLSLTISVVEHAMKAADKQLGSATNGHHLSIAEEQRLTLQAPVVSIMDRRTRKQKQPCLPHWRTKP